MRVKSKYKNENKKRKVLSLQSLHGLQSVVCSLHGLQSAKSAWSARSALCSLHGLRFGVTHT